MADSMFAALETKPRRAWLFGISCCGGCALFLVLGLVFVVLAAPHQYYVPSGSMEPTLHGGDAVAGDHIVTSSWDYRLHSPRRGDIVVFLAPAQADAENIAQNLPPRELTHTKRIVGIPGDTIIIKEEPAKGKDSEPTYCVWRNGARIAEPYIKEPMEAVSAVAIYGIDKPLKLGHDEYFVMGDNRNDSNDSRYWGPLERSRIQGRVTAIVAPRERARQFP